MATTTFDPDAYKKTTTQQWQEAAAAWHRWGPTLEKWLGEATDLMLDLARIGEGSRVLDVAAGAGGQSLTAARRVGTERLRAGDRHCRQLARVRRSGGARRRSRQRGDAGDGRREPRRRRRDLRRRDLARRPHLLPRPAGGAAEMRRALREGGRVSAIVYSTPERNQFFSIPVSIIRRRAGLPAPAPGLPGPFSLGQPGVLAAAYAAAGFEDAEVRAVDAPLRFPSAAECVRFERESFGALHAMLATVTRRSDRGVGGDRGGAAPVRRPGRVRRAVRAARGGGDEIGRPWRSPLAGAFR